MERGDYFSMLSVSKILVEGRIVASGVDFKGGQQSVVKSLCL